MKRLPLNAKIGKSKRQKATTTRIPAWDIYMALSINLDGWVNKRKVLVAPVDYDLPFNAINKIYKLTKMIVRKHKGH